MFVQWDTKRNKLKQKYNPCGTDELGEIPKFARISVISNISSLIPINGQCWRSLFIKVSDKWWFNRAGTGKVEEKDNYSKDIHYHTIKDNYTLWVEKIDKPSNIYTKRP